MQSEQNNIVEVDNVSFEVLATERMLLIPAVRRDAYTLVELSIRIKNNTNNPLHFSFFNSFIPELITKNGQIIQAGFYKERLLKPLATDFLLAMPGKAVTFSRNAILNWSFNSKKKRDRQLILTIPFRDGDFFTFLSLSPETYNLRFQYKVTQGQLKDFDKLINSEILQNIWIGELVTPTVEIHLVDS